jgi:hypothetical protein
MEYPISDEMDAPFFARLLENSIRNYVNEVTKMKFMDLADVGHLLLRGLSSDDT